MSFIDSNFTDFILSIKLNRNFILNTKSTHLLVLPDSNGDMTVYGKPAEPCFLISPGLLMAVRPGELRHVICLRLIICLLICVMKWSD